MDNFKHNIVFFIIIEKIKSLIVYLFHISQFNKGHVSFQLKDPHEFLNFLVKISKRIIL